MHKLLLIIVGIMLPTFLFSQQKIDSTLMTSNQVSTKTDMFIFTNELNSFRNTNWLNIELIEYNHETKGVKLIENGSENMLVSDYSYNDENGNQVYILSEDIQLRFQFIEKEYLELTFFEKTTVFFYKKLPKIENAKLQIVPFQKMLQAKEIKEIEGYYFFLTNLSNSNVKILRPIIDVASDKFTYDSMIKNGNGQTRKEEYYFQ